MSETSSQLDPRDLAYRVDTLVTEFDRPIASTSGMADQAEATLPSSAGGSVHTPVNVQPAGGLQRVNDIIDTALWVASISPGELRITAEAFGIDATLATRELQKQICQRLTRRRLGDAATTAEDVLPLSGYEPGSLANELLEAGITLSPRSLAQPSVSFVTAPSMTTTAVTWTTARSTSTWANVGSLGPVGTATLARPIASPGAVPQPRREPSVSYVRRRLRYRLLIRGGRKRLQESRSIC